MVLPTLNPLRILTNRPRNNFLCLCKNRQKPPLSAMVISALLNLLPHPETFHLAHDKYFERLICREFGRLRANGHIYLDYTGGGLYASSQVSTHQRRLLSGVYGNPHSTNPTSAAATKLCDQARQKVLDFFHAEDYYCIFTPNASGALKLIGEPFSWQAGSNFLALADIHNSVNSIREFCGRSGGSTVYAPVKAEDLTIDEVRLMQLLSTLGGTAPQTIRLSCSV